MSLFSGSKDVDGNNNRLADLIAGSVSDQTIRCVVGMIAAPKIGEVKYTVNLTRPVQGNIFSRTDLPAGFDGWVYANGSCISKAMFPSAYSLFSSISYAGKSDTGTSITVPVITRMFRLNAGSKTPYSEEGSKYAMPSHIHTLGDPTATTVTQTIKRCAFIWSTDVDTTAKGGKMPAVAESDFSYGGVTYSGGIPEAPSAHKGSNMAEKMTGGGYAYRSWDVPIDTNYMTGRTAFSCQTGATGVLTASCAPQHILVPVMIYIGEEEA